MILFWPHISKLLTSPHVLGIFNYWNQKSYKRCWPEVMENTANFHYGKITPGHSLHDISLVALIYITLIHPSKPLSHLHTKHSGHWPWPPKESAEFSLSGRNFQRESLCREVVLSTCSLATRMTPKGQARKPLTSYQGWKKILNWAIDIR